VRAVWSRLRRFVWEGLGRWEPLDRLFLGLGMRESDRALYLRRLPSLEKALIAAESAALERVAALCRGRGYKLMVLIVPSRTQLFSEQVRGPRYDLRQPDRSVLALCSRLGVPAVDLLDEYERVPKEELRGYYYAVDVHWTPAGYRHAAEVLAREVRARFLRERRPR